ncbi:MAG: hypothetical protein HY692_00240, partial [Cyanobacteria bacterium NC_groundwater_1444_Ag_S-0.65um_54_12]|nr:hypothetical protein [Cyanobacteria bacterium NC_groundwater_1444_Ag_S-0.65um_54_12]
MISEKLTAQNNQEIFKCRSDLVISRQVQNGEISYIVKDPISKKYYRFREIEHAILARLDGQRSPSDILADLSTSYPTADLGFADLSAFLRSLKRIDLL